jgi:heme/copper-type cytochrome/quinol oxidase subunit 4
MIADHHDHNRHEARLIGVIAGFAILILLALVAFMLVETLV